MTSAMEEVVLQQLDAIELSGETARAIEAMGNEAVTVLCEAALGSYPSLRPKARSNAVALLGAMAHPQARETVRLLISDGDHGVRVRALRAAGRQRNDAVVDDLREALEGRALPEIEAAEIVDALAAIGTPGAAAVLEGYLAAQPDERPHRSSALVARHLEQAMARRRMGAQGHGDQEPPDR